MRARIFVSAIAISAVAYACGGVDSDLLDGPDSDGGDVGDASLRDSGIRDSSAGKDSGGKSDGGVGTDGGSDSGSDGGIHPKSGIIQCGTNDSTTTPMTVSCNATDPTCCASQYPFDTVNPVSFRCTTNDVSCADFDSGSIPIDCRSSADCSGAAQCCGHEVTYNTIPLNPITIYESVHCQATCELFLADGGENANRLFCDPSATPGPCPVGESCVASTLLPGFNVCGTP